ncbi:MAG: shikimate kinase [Actinomycetia bacterium]|nr:shikimate kinase [Actinomycetes bacterium]
MIGPDQHLVLVGMMAVGKTTVARLAAEQLGRPLFDSDAMVEQRTGRKVRDIFADDGEPAFRELETEMLNLALASENPAVIAAAGGVVLSAGNRSALNVANAWVVWLCADSATLLARIVGDDHRPLLDDDPAGTLQRMLHEREALYREVADAIVAVDHRSIDQVVAAVLQ